MKSVRKHVISKEKTIADGTSLVVDSFVYSAWKGHVEYTLTFQAGTRWKTLKLVARKVDGGVRDQVFARAGDSITLNVDTQLNGSDFELLITNNDTVPVDLVVTRTKP